MRTLLTLAFSFGLIACSQNKDINVSNAWIAEAPPTAQVQAGYFTVKNPTTQTWRLTQVESDQFGKVEMHVMKMQDGMAMMRQVEDFTLEPGSKLELLPGGKHLMLKQPQKALREGDSASLNLQMEGPNGQTRQLQIQAFVTHYHPAGQDEHEH